MRFGGMCVGPVVSVYVLISGKDVYLLYVGHLPCCEGETKMIEELLPLWRTVL